MWLHGSLVHKSSVDSMLVNSLNWQESTGTLLSSALQSFVDTSDMSHGVEQRTRSTQNRRLHGDHATGPLAGPPRETGHWPAGVLWCPVVFRRTPFTGSAASTTGCNYQDVEDGSRSSPPSVISAIETTVFSAIENGRFRHASAMAETTDLSGGEYR